MDITRYITNWSKLYECGKDKLPIVDQMGRDFIRKIGVTAKLDEAVLLADLKKMTRLVASITITHNSFINRY